MRRIISTCGTSIAAKVKVSPDNEQDFRKALRERVRTLTDETGGDTTRFLAKVSAETNALAKLGAGKTDDLVFLHTETPEGRLCAHELRRIADDYFDVTPRLFEIEGLQVTDEKRFRRVGIQNLFSALGQLKGGAPEAADEEVILNVTGGFKSVVPYLTLFGQIYHLDVVYIFEKSNALLRLPPVPISYDVERLALAEPALAMLEKEGALSREDFFAAIRGGVSYQDRIWYESLIEEEENLVTLSAFGHLVREGLTTAQLPVFLSPGARAVYEKASGDTKSQLTFMLRRVSNPLWRAEKRHSFRGAMLPVFKPGRTAERMVAVVREQGVYVCELFDNHDEYERKAGSLSEDQYDFRTFPPWQPPEDEKEIRDTEDGLLQKIQHERDEARAQSKDAEEFALKESVRADAAEKALREAGERSEELTQQAAVLQEAVRERQRPWWKRLFTSKRR